jgi:hypothetical protein
MNSDTSHYDKFYRYYNISYNGKYVLHNNKLEIRLNVNIDTTQFPLLHTFTYALYIQ